MKPAEAEAIKPATTVRLRLRGLTPGHGFMAAVSAIPIVKILYLMVVERVPVAAHSPGLVAIAALLALLPWLWRGLARGLHQAKCDEVAVHVRGEALPFKTLRSLRLERKRRRTILHLVRSEDLQLSLVLWDAYAGRLQPLDPLRERLAKVGLTFDEKI